jgi:hypothetical protein
MENVFATNAWNDCGENRRFFKRENSVPKNVGSLLTHVPSCQKFYHSRSRGCFIVLTTARSSFSTNCEILSTHCVIPIFCGLKFPTYDILARNSNFRHSTLRREIQISGQVVYNST